MFERFTNDARRSVVLSQETARKAQRPFIDVDDLLAGVLALPGSVGTVLLTSLGVDADHLLAQLLDRAHGRHPVQGHIPFTEEARSVLEQTLRTAALWGDQHIGTEHVVMGVLVNGQSRAAHLLHEAGVDAPGYSNAVRQRTDRAGAPPDIPPLLNAIAHLNAGNTAAAQTAAKDALALATESGAQPTLAQAQNLMAWLIALTLAESRFPEALDLVDQALEVVPDDPSVIGTRLAVLTVMGRGVETLDGHEQVLALSDEVLGTERGVSHSFLARACIDAGQIERARTNLIAAEQFPIVWPIHADTRRRLAEIDGRLRPDGGGAF